MEIYHIKLIQIIKYNFNLKIENEYNFNYIK